MWCVCVYGVVWCVYSVCVCDVFGVCMMWCGLCLCLVVRLCVSFYVNVCVLRVCGDVMKGSLNA